jgi:hypothetical protein
MHSFTVDLHLVFLNSRTKFDDPKSIIAQFKILLSLAFKPSVPKRNFKHYYKDTTHSFSYMAELNYNTLKKN